MAHSAAVHTDFLLFQLSLPAGQAKPDSLAQDFARFCQSSPLGLQVHRVAWSAATRTAYAYARLKQAGEMAVEALPALAQPWQANAVWERVRVSRLQTVFVAPGRSQGAAPVFHYIVEMNPETGWMPEISRWYDEEHMPGLAAVEGCILAMRLLNHDHGPYSLACYDLVTDQALHTPAWLAVRGSAWSDITRPHFQNTLRTMFDVLS